VAGTSRTVYIGNLAFVTTDSQVDALFSRCGPVSRVVMGVNKVTKVPCGFAFVM
jgi:nuclear cap-binding protein subunit 2